LTKTLSNTKIQIFRYLSSSTPPTYKKPPIVSND